MHKLLWFALASIITLQQAFSMNATNLDNNLLFLQLSDKDKHEFIYNMGLDTTQVGSSEELDLKISTTLDIWPVVNLYNPVSI